MSKYTTNHLATRSHAAELAEGLTSQGLSVPIGGVEVGGHDGDLEVVLSRTKIVGLEDGAKIHREPRVAFTCRSHEVVVHVGESKKLIRRSGKVGTADWHRE